jgi:N-acetylglucosaminyl-diphospho-decaprenol L-rhamnosyltransferase
VADLDAAVHNPLLASLTAVIVHFEEADLTIRCAEALIEDGLPAERVVVVDNGSRNESAGAVRAALSDCTLVSMGENVGYGRAANEAAAALPGSAYLILNNDAFVNRPSSLTRLLAALEKDGVGIVVPKLLNPDLTLQRSVRPLPTPSVALVQASGLSRFVPNRHQPRWSTYWDHSASRSIEAADGPVMLISGQAWEQLQGFSESVRIFGLESDLCWRAKKLGWKSWFCADAEFVHLGSATTGKEWSRPERAESVGRSEGTVIREQLPPRRATLSIALIAVGLAARYLFFKTRRSPRAAYVHAELRGYLDR